MNAAKKIGGESPTDEFRNEYREKSGQLSSGKLLVLKEALSALINGEMSHKPAVIQQGFIREASS